MSAPQVERARQNTQKMRIKQAKKVCELKWMPEEVARLHTRAASVSCALFCAETPRLISLGFPPRMFGVLQKKKVAEGQPEPEEPKATAVHHLGMDVMAAVKIKGLLRKRRSLAPAAPPGKPRRCFAGRRKFSHACLRKCIPVRHAFLPTGMHSCLHACENFQE